MTINSARYARVDKDLGSIETGKLADLVAVRGNPLEDLAAAANVEIVLKNGNVFTPTQILAPFRTPEALPARERALEGYAKLCATHPHTCEAGASHGHESCQAVRLSGC